MEREYVEVQEQARQAMRMLALDAEIQSYVPARLGKYNNTTEEWVFRVRGRPNHLWIKVGDEYQPALNEAQVAWEPRLPIKVRYEHRRWVIKGVYVEAESAFGQVPGNMYGVKAHPLALHNDVANDAPADNQLLQWDAADSQWEPSSVTTTDIAEGSNLYFTNERAQDAVLGAMIDSASINFTYDDASNNWTGVVIPGGVDHGGLAGLADDDHTQYLLAAGTRPLTANWDIGEDMVILSERFNARDDEGISFYDDGSNLALKVADGGHIIAPWFFYVSRDAALSAYFYMVVRGASSASNFGNILGNGAGELAMNNTAGMIMGTVDAKPVTLGTGGVSRLYITSTGDVGVGSALSTPRGKFHVHDGTSGWLAVTKTAIDTSAQTIIPDGTGDVTKKLYGTFIITQGTNVSAGVLDLGLGATQVLGVGSGQWTVSLSAGGALTVARTSGTGTANLTLWVLWQ